MIEVSRGLARKLQPRGILPDENPIEAMLWLMSRVAWEAHTFAYDRPARDLQARHVTTLLESELGIRDSAALEPIQMGLLLVMQMDPTGASRTILFGHQSFREFLVARYWKQQLLHLVARETKHDQRGKIEERLMQARLLQEDDKAFTLLIEMLHGLDVDTQHGIKEWARKCLEIDDLTLSRDPNDHRRPFLIESALAIGSYIEPEQGLQVDEWALRFLCFWYQFHGLRALIRAPGLRSSNVNLSAAHLARADFKRANLFGANLQSSNLFEANFVEANLAGANLAGANLDGANLDRANLDRAILAGAYLAGAQLIGAQLIGAHLAVAQLIGAQLIGANLAGASLQEANLHGANLQGAILEGVALRKARLHGARVSRKQLASAHTEGVLGLDEIDEIPEPA